MLPGRARGKVSVQLLQTLTGLNHAFLQTPDIGLPAGNIRCQRGFLAPQLQVLLRQSLGVGGHAGQLQLLFFQSLPFFIQGCFNFGNSLPGLVDLGHDAAGAVLLALEFFLNPGDVGVVVLHIAPEDSHLSVQLLVGALEHVHLQPHGFQVGIPGPETFTQFFRLAVKGIQVVMGLLQHEGSGLIVLLRLLGGCGELFQGVQPHGHFHALQFVLQLQVLLGLLGLDLQGFQLQLQLGDLVADAEQVVFGMGQLPLGLFLAVAVLGDTCRFFEDFPAVGTFQGEDLVDSALADIGIALPAQAGVHEQLMDVPQAGGLLVDVIFAITGAVVAPGDHDLVGIVSQRPVRIVQGQSGFRKAHRRTLLGAAEDHVLHLGTAQGLAALLAHDPEDGIGNIRFTGAVGADDGSDVIAEPDQRFIREGLKAL